MSQLLTPGIVRGVSPGWYFQRFLKIWQEGLRGTRKEKAEAVTPLEGWPDASEGPLNGDVELYLAVLARQREAFQALAAAGEGLELRLRSLEPLVTGIGQPHPIENGFAFLKPYGVPYLPASGVKGAVRVACAAWWEKEAGPQAARERLKHYFGSEHKEPRRGGEALDHVRGGLIFFDLFPVVGEPGAAVDGWSQAFRLDVVNPHYGPYYRRSAVPADWHKPVPSFFLTLKADLEWRLRLVYAPVGEPRRDWRAEVEPPLRVALEYQGLGAKKSWGYGVFQVLGAASEPSAAKPSVGPATAGAPATELEGGPAAPALVSRSADSLRRFIATLKRAEVKSQLSRIRQDLARCQLDERGALLDLLGARLGELGLKPKEIAEVLDRVLPPGSADGA